jgi:ppGpp synthetase/RelA/SpoT-type nucleotidyltranferase
LLREEGIYATTESRAKDPGSLENKLHRKQYSSLKEIPDLAGVRIIVRYLSDVQRTVELLGSEFTIPESFPHRYSSPDAFGYVSHHVVVKLSAERRGLREWNRYGDLACEVQIRTILQHAWASISHSLDYKSEEEVPTAVRRDLFRVAALLESGDEMFERYHLAVQNLRVSYAHSEDWRKLPVDAESLRTHWDRFPISRLIRAIDGDPQAKPSTLDGNLLRVVRCCKILELHTLGELVNYLDEVDQDSIVERLGKQERRDSPLLVSFALFIAIFLDRRITGNVELVKRIMDPKGEDQGN